MSDFITGQDRAANWRKLGYCYFVVPLGEGRQDNYERNVNHVGRVGSNLYRIQHDAAQIND